MKPILFKSAMVRAIIDGRKTQTRRVFKGTTEHKGPYNSAYLETHKGSDGWKTICPYGALGDQLWVRETHEIDDARVVYRADMAARFLNESDPDAFFYLSTSYFPNTKWRPSIHMPRKLCRLYLTIKNIRVERLQDISEEDAVAEGVDAIPIADIKRQACFTRRTDFAHIWDAINGKKHPWSSNPWLWVISFERSK